MIDNLSIRPLVKDDATMLFHWRNDPFIVSLGSLQRQVTWEEHSAWVSKVLERNRTRVFIIEKGHQSVGQIRFDIHDNHTAVASIYLLQPHTGKGLGHKAIRLGTEHITSQYDIDKVSAYVKYDNAGSKRSFEKAGYLYEEDEQIHGSLHYRLSYYKIIPHNRLTFDKDETTIVAQAVAKGYWAGGEYVSMLEKKITEVAGTDYAVAVSSGLSAIRLALLSLCLKNDDEVIIPGYCCVALPNAVMAVGAKPVLADIKKDSLNIDPASVKKLISKKTRAIIAVHTFGVPVDIVSLKEYGLPIIEDCAHCIGMEVAGKKLGSWGDLAITSFYSTKLVGGGEGGMIMTNNEKSAAFVRKWRDYSDQPPHPMRMNDKMNNLEAALSCAQLDRLSSMLSSRQKVAEKYLEKLAPHASTFTLPDRFLFRAWYRFPLWLNQMKPDIVIAELKKKGIYTDMPVYDWTTQTRFIPVSEMAYNHILSIPCYPTLNEREQDRVISAVEQVLHY